MNEKTEMHKKVSDIIEKIGTGKEACIPILQAIQEEFRYLPKETLEQVCLSTEITPADIVGVSTFYSQFRHSPVGDHIISVCVGTACHVKGADLVYDALKRFLKIDEDGDTDPNGKYTLQKVACLGCCTLAPVVQIDNVTFGHVSSESVADIVSEFETACGNKVFSLSEHTITDDEENEEEIRIGLGSCCVASGSEDVYHAIKVMLKKIHRNIPVKQVGCIGMCHRVPLVEIVHKDKTTTMYSRVREGDVESIILKHYRPTSILKKVNLITDSALSFIYHYGRSKYNSHCVMHPHEKPVQDFLNKQVRIATEFCGNLDPLNLEDYLANNGFRALKKVLLDMKPKEVITCLKNSGLRGRGGAGFSTGLKWEFVYRAEGDTKYVVCNGDEGDPGAFMDRMLLESYPFRIIEGMLIAARAINAHEGYFYIRAEYPLALQRIKKAISICTQSGYLGENIMGTGYRCVLKIKEGAGAFVCGEETALLASIEGKRGMPVVKPPFPAQEGLWHKPTLVNNVETLANISWICNNGHEAFVKLGTEKSSGTKVFALTGKIVHGGLIEVEQGISLREIVEVIGGGVKDGHSFKAVQIGGPSGGCIPASMLDLPIDYESLNRVGAMIGSGGMVVLDDTDCMVDIARYFLSFTQDQSCGKCTFCRIGTRRMLDILERLCDGLGKKGDIEKLVTLGVQIKAGSLCGLGKTAPNPVLSTIEHFRDEYEAHIEGRCPTGKCKKIIRYEITDTCIGCTICAQKCPVNAISVMPYKVHVIDQKECIQCDTCRVVCPQGSVVINSGVQAKEKSVS